FFFFRSRRRHTRFSRDWSSDVCSSDLYVPCWDSQDVFPSSNGLDLHCKVPPIEEHLKDRPFAWIDDTIGPGDLLWSAWRDDEVAPTRLLRIDPRIGLAEHHVNKLIEWAERIR